MSENSPVKILSVADTVCESLLDKSGGAPVVEGINLILGCGDLPPEYLENLRNRYDVPLLYVLGNHDLRYSGPPPRGCEPIHRRLVIRRGLRIIGFDGSRWYNDGINQYTEKQMTRFIRRMGLTLWRHKGVDLVVTHAPPRFIGDAEDPCHRGFRVFRKLIDRHNPGWFVHGHIHALFGEDSERITTINSTTVVNSYGFYVFEI